jgi:hypothetical protein
MTRKTLSVCLFAVLIGTMFAQQGEVPRGIPHLDHVFMIMMENHGYGDS